MEETKRIRLVFKDDDILSEPQKLEGLIRSWVLLKTRQHVTVSDVASHLLHAFQLHQSCPHGLILSMSGFVLPSFESTCLLNDGEIIRVRKKREILSIEGNDTANAVEEMRVAEKQTLQNCVLLLAIEEFEKENGGHKSDDPEVESDEEDENVLEDMEDPSAGNANPRNRKRKASEKLQDSASKKRCAKASQVVASNVHTGEKKNSHQGGVRTLQKSLSQNEKRTDSDAKDSVKSNRESPTPLDWSGVKQNDEVQKNDKAIEDVQIASKETKKVPSRSARRKYAKRRWMREMANIQKKNAACESEGLRNWKEDQAKAERKKVDGQSKGLQKWNKHQMLSEKDMVDGQPKGLLYWKQSPQHCPRSGKKWQRNQTSWLHEHPNRKKDSDVPEDITRINGDVHEQPTRNNDDAYGQPTHNDENVHELLSHNRDTTKQSIQESNEEHEVVPIVIRPGHIRFEPFEKEQGVQPNHVPVETIQWNGITSKKKGQKWGLANSQFTSLNGYKNTENDNFEAFANEEREQPIKEIEFEKLPTLPGMPKEGDLIAYRILELSSTWTPELSAFRVGKVSFYNTESNLAILAPASDYPIVSKKVDEDEAEPPENSLYKEDGSLEIDFSSLVDVRIIKDGSSDPVNVNSGLVSEGPLENTSASKPGSSSRINTQAVISITHTETKGLKQSEETVLPSAETGELNVWDQISEALDAKKEELSQDSSWGKNSKKLQLVERTGFVKNAKNVLPSQENRGRKNARVQPSVENSPENQSPARKSWSYKALRGSALGPTMDILRSRKEI
ncbi:coilin [Dorcoceras hygrometricum]|nr:coilin [Dorcoceras hygrometricum]